jgi:D-3-phosphoglycerate dehydrogenase
MPVNILRRLTISAMKYCILVATTLTHEALGALQSAKDVDVRTSTPTLADVTKHIGWADALIIRDDFAVDAALLEEAKRLKVIGRAGVGLAGIDVEAATARGVIVMNTPGANATATGEFTMALILALSRHLVPAYLDVTAGKWARQDYMGLQLEGKVLGLIGLGRVGRCVAERAIAFKMEVIAYDPYVAEAQLADLQVKLVGLDEVLSQADIISLHCAATPETYHILDDDALAQVNRGVRIINVAHGNAISEKALLSALRSGQVGGAALDVFEHEPLPAGSPLLKLPNVLYTPHMGDSTVEAQKDLSSLIVQQVLDALRRVDYRNAVNMPFMPGRAFEAMSPYLRLAERIGALQHFLARGRIRRVAVEYKGDELSGMVKPLTVALLKGILEPVLGDSVNYINAPLVAMERGIHVTQTKGLDVSDYSNLVSCQVHWEGGGQLVISGALFNRKEPRIVQIDSYLTDFVPEGTMLVFGSYDVPGVIGRVGTLMAKQGINIAAWRTGRAEKGGQTLTVVTIDQPLPEETLQEFRQQEYVRHATQIVLG